MSSDNFSMEYKIKHLNEREPHCTSLEAHIGGDYQLAIECKFTETGVGTCSRPKLKPENSEYCDGSYSKQKDRKNRAHWPSWIFNIGNTSQSYSVGAANMIGPFAQ